jgi:hypothetical protein
MIKHSNTPLLGTSLKRRPRRAMLAIMNMNNESLVFVDCYALTNSPPRTGTWELITEAYETGSPGNPDGPVVSGGPDRWLIRFCGISSRACLEVSPAFQKDFVPGYESCEIYSMKQTTLPGGTVRVEIVADYIKGSFCCDRVTVEKVNHEPKADRDRDAPCIILDALDLTDQPPSWLNRAAPPSKPPISLQRLFRRFRTFPSVDPSAKPPGRQQSLPAPFNPFYPMRQDYACLQTATVIHLPHEKDAIRWTRDDTQEIHLPAGRARRGRCCMGCLEPD